MNELDIKYRKKEKTRIKYRFHSVESIKNYEFYARITFAMILIILIRNYNERAKNCKVITQCSSGPYKRKEKFNQSPEFLRQVLGIY